MTDDIKLEMDNCDNCGKEIPWKMAQVSFNRIRKFYCIKCQIAEVRRTWTKQPELMEAKIKELEKYL